MHKNEKGDDINIAVAEKISKTVRSSRNGARTEGDVKSIERTVDIENNSIEYDSVRISPSFMEFKDAYEGMTFRQLLIIQNMGKHAAHVRICSPNSIAFEIKTLQRGVFLSPGLRIRRWVHYSYKRTSVLHTMIPIYINDCYIDYHVICTMAKENLSIEPESLDFGIVDIGSTSGIKILTLKNDGGQRARFAVDLGPNDMDLSVKPMRGIVQARSKTSLRIELMGVEEGSFFGEFWIKSSRNIQIPVKVNIIIPRLVVYHPNTTGDFTLIDFPLTFTDTTRHDTLILRNHSALVTNFVVLGEIDNDLMPINNINMKKHPAFQVFTIYPLEGRMDPFEGRVFNMTFSPTVKVIKETEEFRKRENQDFMVFVRIFRVHCTEVEDIAGKDMNMDERVEELFKKVQLLGPSSAESLTMSDGEPPESPGYETVRLCLYGEAEEAHLNFVPNEFHLENITVGESTKRELTLSNPSNSTSVRYKFVPNAAAHCIPSTGRIGPKESSQVLVTVTGNYNVKVPFKLVFDVVIETCNLSTLKTAYKKAKPCWMLCWYKSIIPLGKDQKRKLSSKNSQVTLSTRNDPSFELNNKYALTPEEAVFRSRHRLYWSDYIRSKRAQRDKIFLKSSAAVSNYITDCKDFITAKLPKIKDQSMAQKLIDQAIKLKIINEEGDEILVPLSPLQIYKVKIAPTILAYGLVAPKSTNYRTLRIENLNDFPVMFRLESLVSTAISFPNGSLIILHPGEQITKIIELRAQRIANVVLKSLSLNVREITFGNQYLPQEAYQPFVSFIEIKNKLDATTSFTWEIPSNVSFAINPMSGEVRGNRELFAEVSYESIVTKSHRTEAVLTSESGTWANLKLDITLKKPDVVFINDTLNLDKIPLNITTNVVGVLHNAEFTEVMFQVDSSTLIYGCEVYPQRGVIPPRGIVALEVRLRFDVCFEFSITIDVVVQKLSKLELKLIGQVSYPMLNISPEIIHIKRISVDAFITHLLTASNCGKSLIKIQFLLDDYPECRASLSPSRKDPGIDAEGITLLPGTSISIYLHFIPIDLASYAFYLPIIINGILGPVLMDNPQSISPSDFLRSREMYYVNLPGIKITQLPPTISTVFIDCTISGHVISFSKYIFHFDVTSNKVKDKLRVFNETRQEVSFIIRIDDFSNPTNPFSIIWLSGIEPIVTSVSIVCTLNPGEETFFLIEFKPTESGHFEIEAPIFVRGELEGDMFNSLLIDGINLVSCITCDKTELYFSPLPLGIEGEQKLTLKAEQCQNRFEISAVILKPEKIVGIYTENCIEVKFINGNVVTGKNSSNEELNISVLFRSWVPVAFATRIEFLVSGAVAYSVNVCVIADNCVMTTYGFLRSAPEFDEMVKPQERVSFPSISSRGEGSSSLTRQELISSQKRAEALVPKFDSIPPCNSSASERSAWFYATKLRTDRNENSKFYGNDDDDFEKASLNSKCSVFPPLTSDQYHKLLKAGYPYFPLPIKASDNCSHMQRALNAAEQWMFFGGFKFNFYPSIVDGITAVLSGICSITSTFREKRKTHTVDQSFISLLISLAGPDVLKYIGDTSCVPQDPVERVNYVLKLYDNVLEFLALQGAFLPHVRSEYLLSYNDYLINDKQDESMVKTNSLPEPNNLLRYEKLTKELFQSRSKQCWLDVVLQSFKTLVLKRISLKNLQDNMISSLWSEHYSSISSSASSGVSALKYVVNKRSIEIKSKNNNQYTVEENLLLDWLQHNFETQRFEPWMKEGSDNKINSNPGEKGEILQSRTVSNFEEDLADGLVLIAVTAAHCPYLIDEHFNKIFIYPRNIEEIHHNAVCLTAAWRRIRLGFMITVDQISNPNCVQMVMLVTHLYLTLPTFVPLSTIQFCCPLTEIVTRQISFSNTTEFPVSYIIDFVGNKMNLFSAVTPQSLITVDAHDSANLKIRFQARKIAETKAYVILCGSSIAPHFARNQVFILEGRTNYLGVTNTYDIERILYKVCDEILNITVPFKEAAEYDISFAEEQPTVPASLKLSKWSDLKNRKVPRRLFINQKTITVLKNSYQADLSITIACIAPTRRSFWIVFESEIGDFIIRINSTSKKATTDYITVEWDREKCLCYDLSNGISSMCPLNIKVGIPTRNVQLWTCVNEMFQKTLGPKEFLFWSRHLDTNIGLRLIHWLMGDYHDAAAKEFMHIFNTSVIYDVAAVEEEYLILPTQFAIEDVRPREEEIAMSVHILETTPQVYETMIRFSSPDGMEHRAYKIDFICRTPISSAIYSKTDDPNLKENKRR